MIVLPNHVGARQLPSLAVGVDHIPVWAWIAAVLLIAVAVLIELLKDNELQDWLERCHLGGLVAQRYRDTQEEERQFKLALEG